MKKALLSLALLLTISIASATTYNVTGHRVTKIQDSSLVQYGLKAGGYIFYFCFNGTDVTVGQTYTYANMVANYSWANDGNNALTYTAASFTKIDENNYTASATCNDGNTYNITIAPLTPITNPIDTVNITFNDRAKNRLRDFVASQGIFQLVGGNSTYSLYFAVNSYLVAGTYTESNINTDNTALYLLSNSSEIELNNLIGNVVVSQNAGVTTTHINWVGTDSILYSIDYTYSNPVVTTQKTFNGSSLRITQNANYSFYAQHYSVYFYDFESTSNTGETVFGTVYNPNSDDANGTWVIGGGNISDLAITSATTTYEPYSGSITISDSTLTGTVLFYGDVQYTFNINDIIDTVNVTISDSNQTGRLFDYTSSNYSFQFSGTDDNGVYDFHVGINNTHQITGTYNLGNIDINNTYLNKGSKVISCNRLVGDVVVTLNNGHYDLSMRFVGNDSILYIVQMDYYDSVPAAIGNPLCFTARNGSVDVKFTIKNVTHTIQYSTNGTNWSTYTSNSIVTINANQSVYFRAESNQTTATGFGWNGYFSKFELTSTNGGTVECSGNIMSLYGPDCPNLPLQGSAFRFLFSGNPILTTAPELPATTLASTCYADMFRNCTSLTTAPALPATTLADWCYYGMFYGCTSLTAAPALPATTLDTMCYYEMFRNCTSLTTAPTLPATTLSESCYYRMFCGCNSLAAAPALPATTLAENCYYGMFADCTSLTAAPGLPATTLARDCYCYMFSDCQSLVSAPALPVTTLAEGCYCYMFSGCQSLVSAPALPATTLAEGCYCYMFLDCQSLVTAPALPATTLANRCYYGMFSNCTSLINVPALLATTLDTACYYEMFNDCASLVVNLTGPGTEWSITATTTPFLALDYMFSGTGGTMNGTPSINTIYYIASDTTVSYNVTAKANDAAMGSVTGGGVYTDGAMATLTAIPAANCHFVKWSTGDFATTINIVVTMDTTITAYFDSNDKIYSVTAIANYGDRGSVTGSGQYNYNDVATLSAIPNSGYVFDGWSNGEKNQVIYVTVICDTVVKAIFIPEGTGVDDVNDDEYAVFTEGGRIVVSGATDVFIYDAAGKTIFNGKAESEMQRFAVPAAGIYFVRVDNRKNYRIVVK